MHIKNFKVKHYLVLATITFFILLTCSSTPDVVGKWREIGKTATIEFSSNGTFRAVDNQGMSVTGKYFLRDNCSIRFEVILSNSSIDTLNGKITIKGDELTLRSLNGKEIERYKKDLIDQ